jgi:hypothetical protein
MVSPGSAVVSSVPSAALAWKVWMTAGGLGVGERGDGVRVGGTGEGADVVGTGLGESVVVGGGEDVAASVGGVVGVVVSVGTGVNVRVRATVAVGIWVFVGVGVGCSRQAATTTIRQTMPRVEIHFLKVTGASLSFPTSNRGGFTVPCWWRW